MLGSLSFTLYEVFGYLVPGGVTTLGVMVLYWGLFVPAVPLKCSGYQPGIVTWVGIAIASYLLGHAVQGVGNILLKRAEESALTPSKQIPQWIPDRAREVAATMAGVNASTIEPKWAFRILDEYVVQSGKPGDRDMFVYREGFYRGTAIALFFLALALLVRGFVPGCGIQFTGWVFEVSRWQVLATAFVISGTGRIFVRRYKRFAQYRVIRAVLASLVLQATKEGVRTINP